MSFFKLIKWFLSILATIALVAALGYFIYWRPHHRHAKIYIEEHILTAEEIDGLEAELGAGETENVIAVTLLVDTARRDANAADIILNAPPEGLRFLRFDKTTADFTKWMIADPTISDDGTIEIVGGLPNPGFRGVARVGILYFERLITTDTRIEILDSSRLVANDHSGTLLEVDTGSFLASS